MNEQTGRLRASLRILCCTLLTAGLTYACGGGSDTPTDPGGVRGIRVIAGGAQSDSVTSTLQQALVVEVRDSTGRIAKGVTVQFNRVGPTNQAFVWVSPVASPNFLPTAADTTDAQGRASALVRYGWLPGTALVEVAVPELGLFDTVSFTLKPGAPARVFVSPADTSIAIGATYQLRVVTTDQFLNPISGITPTLSASGVTVSPTGLVTSATAAVRGRIIGTYRDFADTADVWVVPKFPMVYNRNNFVALINTDGTGATTLTSTTNFFLSISPSSVAATPSVVYARDNGCCGSSVWVTGPNVSPRALLSGAAGSDGGPRLSPDGTWVYFVRDRSSIWRAHLDGTGLDSLGSFAWSRQFPAPTISPDGGSVAIDDGNTIKIIDVTTKASRTVPVKCGAPRYSPDGAFFACVGVSDVSIVRTDGMGGRVVADLFAADPDDVSGVDWSPDGKWLVTTTTYQGVVLVEVSSGAVIPLTNLGIGATQVREASFVR